MEKDILVEFTQQNEIYQLRSRTFSETMKKIFDLKQWNAKIFVLKTGLSEMDFSRVKNPKHLFSFKQIITICVALGLDMLMTEYLLGLSGYVFVMDNVGHIVPTFI